jgi:hypothetical protein
MSGFAAAVSTLGEADAVMSSSTPALLIVCTQCFVTQTAALPEAHSHALDCCCACVAAPLTTGTPVSALTSAVDGSTSTSGPVRLSADLQAVVRDMTRSPLIPLSTPPAAAAVASEAHTTTASFTAAAGSCASISAAKPADSAGLSAGRGSSRLKRVEPEPPAPPPKPCRKQSMNVSGRKLGVDWFG